MKDTRHMMEVSKNRLLYDKQTLDDVRDRLVRHDVPPKATEVKAAVKTTATIYEIRTAIEFYNGSSLSHRESERVWSNLEAFENGEWELDGTEIVYGDAA